MEFIHEAYQYIVNQPASTWTTLGAYLAGSTVVASLLQVVKHKLNFADAKKLLVFAMGFLSFLVAFADFLLQTNAVNPLPTIGHMTGLIMAGAVVVHRFAVSPLYYSLSQKIANFSKFLDDVAAMQAQKKAPAGSTAAQLPDEANLSQFQL